MNVIRQYKRNIVENKSMILLSTILTITIRLVVFYLSDIEIQPEDVGDGFLWKGPLVYFLSSGSLSFFIALLCTFLIAFYSSQINTKFGLIRNRTYLIYVFACLIFSSHPVFTFMNHYYIAVLAFLACIDLLYPLYQDNGNNKNIYAIGFIIGASSLFSFFFLMYLPLFWIGFSLMRIFNLKKIIISTLGVLSIYWLVFVYYLSQGKLGSFVEPFTHFYPILSDSIQSFSFTSENIVVISMSIFLILISLDYQTNSFKDKIKIRANIYFFNISALYAILLFLFIAPDPTLSLYILASCMTIQLAHFFSLAEQRWKVITFYSLMLVYFSILIFILLN